MNVAASGMEPRLSTRLEIDMQKGMLACLALAVSAAFAVGQSAADADEASIGQLLHAMFDKPGNSLAVEPVMVSGDFAVADWAQGEMGSRALLRRQHDAWTLILCAGDGIRTGEGLVKVGVPAADAAKLAQDMSLAEAKLGSEKVAMFSRFEGLVMMDGSESHHPK